jgi:hypothetical protein
VFHGGKLPYSIPVIGQPIAFGIGFGVLMLVALTGGLGGSLVTVAHEGGHMLMALASGRGVVSFTLIDRPGRMDGETGITRIRGLGVSTLLFWFVGYPTPSLLGLGGAYVIAHGNSWSVLWVAIVLLAALLLTRKNALAGVITGLALAGVFWAAIAGTPTIQAAVAVGLVWLMLIGGLRDTMADGANAGDAGSLAGSTWIPRIVWAALWFGIALLCLWFGTRVLLALY